MKSMGISVLTCALAISLAFSGCGGGSGSSAEPSYSGTASSMAPTAPSESYSYAPSAPAAEAERGAVYDDSAPAGEFPYKAAVDGAAPSEEAAGSADRAECYPEPPGQREPVLTPREGLLTAGEWNDNQNFSFLQNLMQSHYEWSSFAQYWRMTPERRVVVTVRNQGQPVANALVTLSAQQDMVLWQAKTDNTGTAYLFNGLGEQGGATPDLISVSKGDVTAERKYSGEGGFEIELAAQIPSQNRSLDLMLVIDTTGSMGDELEFLKRELESVVTRVKQDNANIPVRLSVNVYRDLEDDYVVRSSPFDTSVRKAVNFLGQQSASGGGDFEEAVELALDDAINRHDWDMDATARILFLVLDAPPHNTPQNRNLMPRLIFDAANKGIRIIPVASSGIDKNTEFLLRTMSVATGGSYVFLTDHSGVGESHLEPTIGAYQVELLNDLLVRLVNQYLA